MKWNADIIYTPEFSDDKYRGSFCFDDGQDWHVYGPNWKDFCAEVIAQTGIMLPARKHFLFCKLSDYEQIAGIDASHIRKTCIVSPAERKAGWKRYILD